MNSQIYKANNFDTLLLAKRFLDHGEIVVVPSETVYGLAGSIYSIKAIDKIYAAKNRPQDNPLICHVSSYEQILTIAEPNKKQHAWLKELINLFSPGPLTFILPKKQTDKVNYAAQKQDTVAVRIPAHPVFLQLIQNVGYPLAAPSANVSGRPSGTSIHDIVSELKNTVSLFIEDAPSEIGLESTVLDLTQNKPTVLRPGAISLETLQKWNSDTQYISGMNIESPKSPGQKYKHYQPSFPVFLWNAYNDIKLTNNSLVAIITHSKNPLPKIDCTVFIYEQAQGLARDLYHLLYKLEKEGYKELWVQTYSEQGIGRALMERLRRIAEN